MTTRINGYSQLGAEHVLGDNGFLTIVVNNTNDVHLEVTGITATLAELLTLTGADVYADLVGTPAQPRDHDGALITTAALYTENYARQTNLNRIIDHVATRGVILASSVAVVGTSSVGGGFSSAVTGSGVNFMIQDREGFLYGAPVFGVPSATNTVTAFVASLALVTLLSDAGVAVTEAKAVKLTDALDIVIS